MRWTETQRHYKTIVVEEVRKKRNALVQIHTSLKRSNWATLQEPERMKVNTGHRSGANPKHGGQWTWDVGLQDTHTVNQTEARPRTAWADSSLNIWPSIQIPPHPTHSLRCYDADPLAGGAKYLQENLKFSKNKTHTGQESENLPVKIEELHAEADVKNNSPHESNGFFLHTRCHKCLTRRRAKHGGGPK